ncbi:MAG: hypothetical protein J5999_04335 [Oscillospiraceae bacterium]|nr:hypothetical protein [Oscillospiraceae bacterium]
MVNELSPIFPLSLPMHIGFVIISLIVLLVHRRIRKRQYQLYLGLGILSTLLVYVDSSSWYMAVLGMEELVLVVLALISMHKYNKEREAEENARSEKAEEKSDESSDS